MFCTIVSILNRDKIIQTTIKPKRSGRPLGFSRERSIEGAMNLFWEKGIGSVTAMTLATAMGIQRSSFYNTFNGKEAIFKEVLEYYNSLSPERWLGVIKARDPVLPQLRGYLRELCKVRAADQLKRGCLFCNCVTELAGKPDELGQLLTTAVKDWIILIECLFDQAETQGEIAEGSYTDDMASGFVAFIFGLNTVSKVIHNEARLWETCETYLDGLYR